MIFVRRQVSLCNLVAVIFAATGILLGSGCARITSMDLQIAPPGPVDNAPDESESASSDQATAALTPPSSGDILMIGGAGSAKSTIASAEFFSAATSKFKATGAMKKTRAVAGGVALPAQHEVAIFGGMKGHATSSIELLTLHSTVLNSAETYDSTTGKFTTVATPMDDARTGFTATVFPSGPLSGKVLIAGGSDGTGPTDSAEIFDPTNNTFTAAGNTMTDPREYHTATLLNDGTVLLAGGLKDPAGDVSTTADIFDPATQKFTRTTHDMTIGHAAHTASLLTTGHPGQVLLVAGVSSTSGGGKVFVGTQSTAELFDPSSQTFTPEGFMTESRAIAAAVTLGDGRVLITGGLAGAITISGGKLRGGGSTSNSSEIYDPADDTFTCANGTSMSGFCNPSMLSTRAGHIAMPITAGPNSGKVLLAGGIGAKKRTAFNDLPLKTAEIVTVSGTTMTSVKVKMTAARVGFTAVTVP